MVFEDIPPTKLEILRLLNQEFRRLLLNLTNRLKNEEQINKFLTTWGTFIPPGAHRATVCRIGNMWVFDLQSPPGN